MKPYYSYLELQKALKSKKTTCFKTTRLYLSRISDQTHLNIFVEVFEKEALAKSKLVDEKIQKGTAGKLAGMVGLVSW